MHTVNEAKIKKTLKAAINAGSRILLKSYKKNDFKVELKSAKEWVTETDVAVEKSIVVVVFLALALLDLILDEQDVFPAIHPPYKNHSNVVLEKRNRPKYYLRPVLRIFAFRM